jgi:hypothetical protein
VRQGAHPRRLLAEQLRMQPVPRAEVPGLRAVQRALPVAHQVPTVLPAEVLRRRRRALLAVRLAQQMAVTRAPKVARLAELRVRMGRQVPPRADQ